MSLDGIHTYDVSMKARSKSHLAIKINCMKWKKRTLQQRQNIVLTNAALLRFVIIVPIIGKT